MASGFLRQGLRDEEVNRIVRRMRTLRSEGAGPEEAWVASTSQIVGVDPASFKGWKDTIFKQVEQAGPLDPTASRTNIYTRTAELAEELSATKRKLADAGTRIEQLTATTANIDGGKIADLEAQLATVKSDFEQRYESIVNEAKDRLAKKDAEIAQLKEQLEAVNELIKNPKRK